jgi:predicted metal-dependent peptidase
MSHHSGRASVALRALNESDPAMAALSLWCAHRDVDQGPVAVTAGRVIRYGPGFADAPLHEQMGLVGHHVLHVALGHADRMAAMEARMPGRFDPVIWGLAADSIVNEALLAADYALPRPAVTLTGLLLAVTSVTHTPVEALASWDVDRLYIRLMQTTGSRGKTGDYAKAQMFRPDLAEGEGGHDPEGDSADWRAHVTRAMETGRMAGRGIGVIGHRIADLPVPRTPWEVILRGIVTRAVMAGAVPTHRRPARRWIAADASARLTGAATPAFQPGTRPAQDMPLIAVGLDTSSSIDADRRAQFLGEIAGIARRTGAEVVILPFDETVESAVRLDPGRWTATLARMETRQGGGTDYRPLITAARALDPSILVILTDLDGEAGDAPPRLPVLWAVPDAATLPPVPFGQVITLSR